MVVTVPEPAVSPDLPPASHPHPQPEQKVRGCGPLGRCSPLGGQTSGSWHRSRDWPLNHWRGGTMSTEREQRQETEEKIKTFGGSNVKHGLGNRVLGWTGQGVEERDQGWTPGSRRREEIQGASLVCRPRSFWRTWRGMASTGGPRKGPRMGGPCREHPGKPQSTGADASGRTLQGASWKASEHRARRKRAAASQEEDQGSWDPGRCWATAAGQSLASSGEGSFQSEVSSQPGSGTLSRQAPAPELDL